MNHFITFLSFIKVNKVIHQNATHGEVFILNENLITFVKRFKMTYLGKNVQLTKSRNCWKLMNKCIFE